MELKMTVSGGDIRRLTDRLEREAPRVLARARGRAFSRITYMVQSAAKANAPISPTKAQYEANMVMGWRPKRTKVDGVAHIEWGPRRNAVDVQAKTDIQITRGRVLERRSTLRTKRTDFNPGGLVRSIDRESDADRGEVFVAANAEAGQYAHYIEAEGIHGTGKWRNRGIGTRRKGPRADDKFLERAALRDVGRERMERVLRTELERAVESLNQ